MNAGSGFRINVDPLTMTRSAAGQIAGRICVQVGDVAFPDSQWSDSVVVVLLWWLAALEELSSCRADSVQLQFMDGPFALDLRRGSPTGINVTGVQVGALKPKRLTSSLSVYATELRASVYGAAISIVTECSRRGWSNRDVTELATRCRSP